MMRASMSQRPSGYERSPNEGYKTIAWPVAAVLPHVSEIRLGWPPCDDDPGRRKLVAALRALGVGTVRTSDSFTTAPSQDVTHVIANPPHGEKRRVETVERFTERALELHVPSLMRKPALCVEACP
jgi:hypothetical protein